MAEKDATARLRRAVKENNLFLVKRLIQKTEQRNTDTASRRYTSLAWAAVLGHEETFEFLLANEHDDQERSRDSEGNSIIMLLAEHATVTTSYVPHPEDTADTTGAALRMTRLYFDRYPDIIDWANTQGKTALHLAALKGNEELARMLCDLGADLDLSDNVGNTPLHYASSWGHIPVVQLLIERGCLFTAKNNKRFTASDYAYSFSTMTTLQDAAWAQVENKKKSRRGAARVPEWGAAPTKVPSPLPAKARQASSRMRSGSGTSRTTATSDSGESIALAPSQSASSSPSLPSGSNSVFHSQQPSISSSTLYQQGLNVSNSQNMALSPVANRMRERDADAMEKYLRRNRSETSSDTKSSQNGQNFTSGPSVDGDDIGSLDYNNGASTPRRLRPSLSAAQLRTNTEPAPSRKEPPYGEVRSRSGTNPSVPLSPRHVTSSSTSAVANTGDSKFTGPSSQYARFPEPPPQSSSPAERELSTPTASTNRRLPFHIMPSRPSLDSLSVSNNHRRGLSASSRGPGG